MIISRNTTNLEEPFDAAPLLALDGCQDMGVVGGQLVLAVPLREDEGGVGVHPYHQLLHLTVADRRPQLAHHLPVSLVLVVPRQV